MYCRKCGKFMDYQAEICLDCQRQCLAIEDAKSNQEVAVSSIVPQKQVVETQIKTGKFDGLAKAIISLVFILVECCILTPTVILTRLFFIGGIYSFAIIDPFLIISSFIMAISSIKQFKRSCREGRQKPVATLIIGIFALVISSAILVIASLFGLAMLGY